MHGKKEIEGGMVHRVDTETTGLLLCARNQQFYDYIIQQQNIGNFRKYYTAYCNYESESEIETKNISTYFRPFGPKGSLVKPVSPKNMTMADKKKCGDKLYETEIKSVEEFDILEHNKNILKITC